MTGLAAGGANGAILWGCAVVLWFGGTRVRAGAATGAQANGRARGV